MCNSAHMPQPRRRNPSGLPLGYDELDSLERELIDDVIAAISSSKRRHRPELRTAPAPGGAAQQLAII